ncbi:hypothetical protein E8E12_009004 [Didymella heteroderae]|uniref:Uncharacterized protein n=1 Tax=Didymella heteroderae TaxID=1769908 RepID=A0A9P5C2P9_9PLEO|nr:hypothetical protein E8E12_009004 [Didymella heteroderae]
MQVGDPRIRKKVPLRHSLLFNKPKHSEDWHQTIESVAGVIHPSDSKFPYHLLRQATDVYLKKKGKITQADADIRLALLIDGHEARDIAVAAAAHAITATSLRAMLHVDLNVAHGSYWGLETWLQCLIAANYGNPASFTDLEATWARHLLPFATYGPGAAGKLLIGISRAARECATPNMNMVPEFFILTSRALEDYAIHLEGLRLKNNWIAAYGASCWMAELARATSAPTQPGSLLPEHMLDSQFPLWRVWASWRPDLRLVRILSSIEGNNAAVLTDMLALEGPDFISGARSTLREGLIEQYASGRGYVKLGALLVEVPGRTKDGLREILESAISILASIWTSGPSPDRSQLFRLFTELAVARPMTQENLNLVQAALFMSAGSRTGLGSDFIDAILYVYTAKEDLGGIHIRHLQNIICLFDQDRASSIRRILSTPSLFQGLNNCIHESQTAIRTLIEQDQAWTELALEFHTFCLILKSSRNISIVGEKMIEQVCLLLPSREQISTAIEIYSAVRGQKKTSSRTIGTDSSTDGNGVVKGRRQRVLAPSFLTDVNQTEKHPLEEVVEQYFLHRLLSQQAASYTSQRTLDALFGVWEGTSGPKFAHSRRLLAILVANITAGDEDLRIRCLNGIAATDEQLGPGLTVPELLAILQEMDKSPENSIVKLIRLLARCSNGQDFKAQLLCWRDLTYHQLTRESRDGVFNEGDLLKHTLVTMKAAEWLIFMEDVQSVFISGPPLPPDEKDIPAILRSTLQRYRKEIAQYTNTLTRLETAFGSQSEPLKCILVRDGVRSSTIVSILQALKAAEGKPEELFLQRVVGLLSPKTNNGCKILECIMNLQEASVDTVRACKRIWDAKHGFLSIPGLPQRPDAGAHDPIMATNSTTTDVSTNSQHRKNNPIDPAAEKCNIPAAVVEAMVAGWLQNETVSKDVKDAIHLLAGLLGIKVFHFDIPQATLTSAASFWQKIEDDIIQEEGRLVALRKALKAKDPKGTTLLLQKIGVPDTTKLDEEMMKLPAGVKDLVERLSDNEVEMTFTLAAFTQLQRAAMGVPKGANSVMLQLSLDYNAESSPSFCLHYNTDEHFETLAHTRYVCTAVSENPTKQICTSEQTALTWQLSRIIYSEIRRGKTGVADIFQYVDTWLPKLAQLCVSCSTRNTQTIQLRRSTPCTSNPYACAQLWYNLPLHVRVPEIRTDTFAVDMALASVYAAAMANKPELLPDCPIRGNEYIKSILNALPPMRVMRDAVNLSSVLASYHPNAEKLISWAVVHHRGFLATAIGLLKIPNLPPGTHQFVLANASPKRKCVCAKNWEYEERYYRAVSWHESRPLARHFRTGSKGLLWYDVATHWRCARQGDLPF